MINFLWDLPLHNRPHQQCTGKHQVTVLYSLTYLPVCGQIKEAVRKIIQLYQSIIVISQLLTMYVQKPSTGHRLYVLTLVNHFISKLHIKYCSCWIQKLTIFELFGWEIIKLYPFHLYGNLVINTRPGLHLGLV